MKKILIQIYGEKKGLMANEKLEGLLKNFTIEKMRKPEPFTEKDVILITYADTLKSNKEPPLKTLYKFTEKYFKGIFSTIHFLPFFPYSSDDGFSITDFFQICPEYGSWNDVEAFSKNFRLMFDFVVNHISSESEWFARYLSDEDPFQKLAIEVDPKLDLSMVTRPRSNPLLTEFKKKSGESVHIWTTFSSDQIDLNYDSIEILEKMIQVLLFYVNKGADILRLDAIAYVWKKIGTPCIHLDETHNFVKLIRKILDKVSVNVKLITETNVPHADNISYFGNGKNEAQLIYNFTLPPLLLYTFIKENSKILSKWANRLESELKSKRNNFFNFTASHDGIGVRPLEGILSGKDLKQIIEVIEKNGGYISYKKNYDGSESPYEMNITYIDALLNDPETFESLHVKKFLASQAIQLSLPGVPGIYIHSVLGSRNWNNGVQQTNMARAINREKLSIEKIKEQLADPTTFRFKIFFPYLELIKTRIQQPAFHPEADFQIAEMDSRIFTIIRKGKGQTIFSITNISHYSIQTSLKLSKTPKKMLDLISNELIDANAVNLSPFQYLWLSARV